MLVYFDTSALVKRYLVETDSPAVEALWNKTTRAVASEILYDEMAATFARKKRDAPSDAENVERAHATFRAEWLSLRRVAVNDDVHRRVEELLLRHSLRGADAIHLASATLVRDALQQPLTFACADAKLVAAARAEGLDVIP
ncbi:MAG TPA: type II toxin-antitoxin system VapC family toxin [Polyangiaceae bacterium]|nr:type II toxin-antitoxin system VapC family toxin [Polyangiaceae bacterium]